MKIRSFSIEGFRSIKMINEYELLDINMACLIGPNGSGKSNILKALSLLKGTYQFDEIDYFEGGSEQFISIKVGFELDQTDLIINGIDLGDKPWLERLMKFEVNLTNTPDQTFITKTLPNHSETKLSDLIKALNHLEGDLSIIDVSILEQNKQDLLWEHINTVRESIEEENLSNFLPQISEILDIVNLMDNSEEGVIPSLISIFENINLILQAGTQEVEIQNVLESIWSNTGIEFIDSHEDYDVEENVESTELVNRETHPFLFDLLSLSGKKAENFNDVTFRTIIKNCRQASAKLTEEMQSAWPSHEMEYLIAKIEGSLFFGVVTPQGTTVGLSQLSDGEKWYLRFYTKLAIANKKNSNTIWLFDEPGRDLHATSQIDLRNFLALTSQDSQILYTTHQPMMIPWNRLEQLCVVNNLEGIIGDNDFDPVGTIIHNRFWRDSGKETTLDSPLKEALGLVLGEHIFTGMEHVVVEGISDYFYLSGWLRFFQNSRADKIWNSSYGSLNRSFVPADGLNNIPLYVLFLARRAPDDINCVSIPDSAEDAKTVKETFGDRGFLHLKDRTKSLEELSNIKGLVEVENLFSQKDYFSLVSDYYKKNYPDIKIPEIGKFPASLDKWSGKITRYINERFSKRNIDFLGLDKTGVAMHAYRKLSSAKSRDDISFSKKSEDTFSKILQAIDNLFN